MNEYAPSIGNQRKTDQDHLTLLWIFHLVCGVLALLGILFVAGHFAIMQTVLNDPQIWKQHGAGGLPREMFGIMIGIYAVIAFFMVVYGVLNGLSAWGIRARKWRTFSLVVAGLNCLQIPLGTALGICTILVLSRDSVRELYGSQIN